MARAARGRGLASGLAVRGWGIIHPGHVARVWRAFGGHGGRYGAGLGGQKKTAPKVSQGGGNARSGWARIIPEQRNEGHLAGIGTPPAASPTRRFCARHCIAQTRTARYSWRTSSPCRSRCIRMSHGAHRAPLEARQFLLHWRVANLYRIALDGLLTDRRHHDACVKGVRGNCFPRSRC